MDMSEGNDDHSSYPSSSLTPDWQFSQQIDPPTIGNAMSSIPMGWNQGLIERAARFSCFNGGSFGPLESAYPSASQSPMNTDQSPRDLGEAEASGDGDDNSCSRANSAKKRKGIAQEMGLDDANEKLQKVDQKSTSAKGSGTDGAKGDYIHVRARRGQATNSHSLAERVRREKISERMKFLQDLVPGCSKVTGKAVMLDEIINYVQSLQRQVEFLSMKLAAVNPRLDFNIGLLSKDLLHLRGGSSAVGNFLPEVIRPQLQHGFAHSGIPGIGNTSDAHRRAMNAQLASANGFKEHLHQMPNAWDEELNNVVQMNFVANPSFDTQELNTKPGEGFPL